MTAMDMPLFERFPSSAPSARLIWEALVEIDERTDLGIGPMGARGIIPITGGRFRGGPAFPDFHGVIVPGGADRQLLRPDGAKELDALYEMKVHDGSTLTIRNRVIIDETDPGAPYRLSHIQVTAPQGRWGWLNRRIILGTLQSTRPDLDAVIIRGWETSA